MNALVAVESQRCWPNGCVEQERRYFISSRRRTGAKQFGQSIRRHWHIENKLHWSLDMSFNEDACRVRKGYAAENFSRLRRMALSLLKREETAKIGINAKRLLAGWDQDYLLNVLTA